MPLPETLRDGLWGKMLLPAVDWLWNCDLLWRVLGLILLTVLPILVIRWRSVASWFWRHMRLPEQVEHDARIFKLADAIMPEGGLLNFVEKLRTDTCLQSGCEMVGCFCETLSLKGNQYANGLIRDKASVLVTSLVELYDFVSVHYFSPERGPVGLLVLYPERRNQDPFFVDEKGKECVALAGAAMVAYEDYRLAVKSQLIL